MKGLLGLFDHEIQFPQEWEYVILHGPNGVGKTKLLELTSTIFSEAPSKVLEIPFDSAIFRFEDGSSLHARVQADVLDKDRRRFSSTRRKLLRLTRQTYAGEQIEWESLPIHTEPTREILSYLERVAPITEVKRLGAWRDHEVGDLIDRHEVLDRYSHLLDDNAQPPIPTPITDFLESVNVNLIETQRLLTKATRRSPTGGYKRMINRQARVNEYAGNLASRIGNVLATNSTASQQLDRSFPRRMLSQGLPEDVTSEGEIRERYDRQSRIRNELSAIGILDTEEDLPLPAQELNHWERFVLSTWLKDTERKLLTFKGILAQITAFRDIINSRFQYKEMRLDRRRGFYFVTDGEIEIEASDLSSGEQHELVLMYDLVFNVRHGALALIDEPEISLHVAWQQRFLKDITRISDLNGTRFIVATHSPQIVHKSWDRTVSLGSVEG